MLPGATVSFSTTGRSGRNERSVSVIQYSGSNTLQLPFALFGLGETPNFIEDLTVGAGHFVEDGVIGNGNETLNFKVDVGFHRWSLLVPNSQVIVSLFPIDDASRCVTGFAESLQQTCSVNSKGESHCSHGLYTSTAQEAK